MRQWLLTLPRAKYVKMAAFNLKWKYEKLVAVVRVSQTTQNFVPDFTPAVVSAVLIHDTFCLVAVIIAVFVVVSS